MRNYRSLIYESNDLNMWRNRSRVNKSSIKKEKSPFRDEIFESITSIEMYERSENV